MMGKSWEITSEKVRAVVEKIIEVSNPKKIILFGSYVRGESHLNSDLDILVVTGNEIETPRRESVRIRRALKGIIMSMDILVVQESRLKELEAVPGLIYREGVNKGEIIYEAA